MVNKYKGRIDVNLYRGVVMTYNNFYHRKERIKTIKEIN